MVFAWAALAQSASAVPKPAPSGEQASPAEEGEPAALEDTAPTLEDSSPTIEPAQLKEPETVIEEVAPVSNSIAAAVLLPDRCVQAIELPPEEGSTSAEPKEKAEAEQGPECIDMVDAEPMVLGPDGPVPISQSGTSPDTEETLLLRLEERRTQLQSQQQDLKLQSSLLEAAEKRLSERAAELANVEAEIGALVDQREEQTSERIEQLVALYESMKPAEAAAVLSGLPDEVLQVIIAGMSTRKLAAVMAEMGGADARAATLLMLQPAGTTAQR